MASLENTSRFKDNPQRDKARAAHPLAFVAWGVLLTTWVLSGSLGLLSGCGGRSRHMAYGDCYEMGTCECSKQEHCPDGQHCINGSCGYFEDAAVELKGFNEPCLDDDECESGFCLGEGPSNGGVCTRSCAEMECPDGWDCKPQANSEPREVLLCVQSIDSRLCQTCSVDAHCNAIGDLCLERDDGEFYCAQDCTNTACPEGYVCTDYTLPGWTYTARQCVPEGGLCDCTETTIGLTQPCTVENEFGECNGTKTCLPGEVWSECDATPPAMEVCDGVDNDCDGLTDDLDPGIDVSMLPEDPPYPICRRGQGEGNCVGVWNCVLTEGDVYEWECSADEPGEEVCNGRDDDCDGITDDEFIDLQGRYVTVEHCDHCGKDCTVLLENLLTDMNGDVVDGAVECQVRDELPICVPILCEPGYYPYPEDAPVRCAELISPACRPCMTEGDCVVSTDRCLFLDEDGAKFCHQSCEPTSYYEGCTGTVGAQDCCPDGYLCSDLGGEKLCVPEGGSCRCNLEKVGTTRPCNLTGSSGGAICQGEETCEQTGPDTFEWSECVPSTTTVEVCDELDNNCDGEIDEGFRNALGFYTTDEHCGECNNNCLARWNEDIQHAIGGCMFRPPTTYRCEIVDCTSEGVPGGGFCRLDTDCPTGWSCHLGYHQCVRSCTTATNCDFGQECVDEWCAEPCNSNSTCSSLYGSESVCDGGYCRVVYDYQDADGAESNGCECAASAPLGQDAPDIYPTYPEPGWPYVDRDCDGVDGNAGSSLYVWAESPSSQGTLEEPFATVQEALSVYNPSQHAHILVAAGTYEGNLELSQGVRLYGGYSPDFAARDVVLYPTVLRGVEPDHNDPNAIVGTIHIEGVSGLNTAVVGFTIYGYDVNEVPSPGSPGYGSYAVYVKNSGGNLTIANNRIYGGRGGDGAPGDVGSTGSSGAAGDPGQNSWECPNSSDCSGYQRQGGSGGTNNGCSGANGQPGATSRSYNFQDPQDYTSAAGGNGLGGYNSVYAHSEPSHDPLCKYDCQVGQGDGDGQDAQNGSDGSAGSGGNGCANIYGQIVGDVWRATNATNGGVGTRGTGGGGGGAGGSVINQNWNTSCSILNPNGDLGATGGGGGAAGCGGGGGNRGGGGGGSLGVFLVYSGNPSSFPDIYANLVYVGRGGPGGQGGAGGQGGRGSQGGRGGEIVMPAWCAGAGGSGGRGGDGGGGGGGGGGCGGAAFGVAGESISSAGYGGNNTFISPAGSGGGEGGTGGPSPAGSGHGGTSGSTGGTADVRSF